ncbi:MAG: DNA internalization-related competence protein ComEC/Rec2 [Legionellales bacterium RIFCSPHIGHO2_12_FULL_37_14]|nr:MAG: DNA internalization-related competence protein ComEC/Rec2 [Legionellales bacterium RIFCSPHIGHO2_12_FULL_37_14]
MEILCFFAGIALFYSRAFEILAFIVVAYWYQNKASIVICFLLGSVFAYAHQLWTAPNFVTKKMVLNHVVLEGVVANIPKVTQQKTQFKFQVATINEKKADFLVWMSCYQSCPIMHVGESWLVLATLKKPKPNTLPYQINPKFWMLSNHISWFAVMHKALKKIAQPSLAWGFQSFRFKLAEDLANHIPKGSILGLIQGLTLGMGSLIETDLWELFRRTGTTHLVVISGEHLGLIAGFSFLLFRFLWSLIPIFMLYIPAQRAAACIALGCAIFYAFLTGLGAPVERALIGFGVLVLRYFVANKFTIWQAWRYALLCIVCLEPHIVVNAGFYLSFSAVAVLIITSKRFSLPKIQQMLTLQFACLIGLIPITLYAFSYASLSGFLVNILAIPLVGLVMVPTSLIGLLLIEIFPWSGFLWFAKVSAQIFVFTLQKLDNLSSINFNFTIDGMFHLFCIMLGIGLFIVMPVKSLVPLYFALILFAIFPPKEKLALQEIKAIVFDVGQGLAILVETKNHMLLYDTGGAFYQGGDWASITIIPYLIARRVKHLDAMVISHQDLDHRGGMSSIEKNFKIKDLWVNDPNYYHKGESCHNGASWEWDKVYFRFFALPKIGLSRNNTCCVLQIKSPYGAILIPGDIEKSAEDYLVQHYGKDLEANYLIVPHHGSKTSSSIAFLQTVNPTEAFISSGLNNKFHFPHSKTLATYKHLHINLHNTGTHGPIEMKIMAK